MFADDLRLALRRLLRARTFTITAVITLALGIGATTAIFTIVNAVLLRPLPYRDADRLVHLWEVRAQKDYGRSEASFPDFEDWKAQSRTVEMFAGYSLPRVSLFEGGRADQLQAAIVTDTFFDVLGVNTALGRTFRRGEELETAPRVAILTDALWRRRFGSDRNVIGRTVHIDGETWEVAGVLPPEFHFAPSRGAEIYLPIRPDEVLRTRRKMRWINVIARLRPGVTSVDADREIDAIAARIAAAYPDSNEGASVDVVPLREQLLGSTRPVVLLLASAALFVFFIACANVGGLMIARSVAHERSTMVRMALGARRSAIVRHLLAEGVLLTAAGTTLGVMLGLRAIRALVALLPPVMLSILPALRTLTLDLRFAAVVSTLVLATVLGAALWPALRTAGRLDAGSLLHGRGTTGGRRERRLRSLLVVLEIALSLLLVTGAGLMVRSLDALFGVSTGYDPNGVLTMRLSMPSMSDDSAMAVTQQRVVDALAAIPGATFVSLVSKLPSVGGTTTGFHTWRDAEEREANYRTAGAGYFALMRIPVIRGREFDRRDRMGSQNVVLVNRLLANRDLGGEDVVGRTLRMRDEEFTIAGVVGDERVGPLDDDVTPVLYFPAAQGPSSSVSVVLRTTGDPMRLAHAAEEAVRAVDPSIAVAAVAPMTKVVAETPMTFLRRMTAIVVGAFAAISLILALVGIYGVMAESVAIRRREIGVRLSFGALPSSIVGMVMRESFVLTLMGTLAGAVAALVLSRGMRSLLYGVGPADPVSFAAGAAILVVTAAAAALLPAMRASRTDPVSVLRDE